MKSSVIEALHEVLADKKTRTSGNIDQRVREMPREQAIAIADGHVQKNGMKNWEAFEHGLTLGRDIREKIVYRSEIDQDYYWFVGTENEIVMKLDQELQDLMED